jgi:hypothetical protein
VADTLAVVVVLFGPMVMVAMVVLLVLVEVDAENKLILVEALQL